MTDSDDAVPPLVRRFRAVAVEATRWLPGAPRDTPRTVLEDVLTRPANQERMAARAHALYGAAGLAVYQGDYDSARSRFEESLAISRELDDGRCIARALNGLGFLAIEQNDYAAGREFFEASLATLLRDPARLAAMKREVRLAAVQWDWDRLALQMEDLYQEARAGGRMAA